MSAEDNKHEYQDAFFDYINEGSTSSARVIAPLLTSWLAPNSLLDVGCGAGAWCKVWKESGVSTVHGVDGEYVNPDSLLIDRGDFSSHDLSRSFNQGRRFDLVTSLEVAEHVAESSAETFVDNLAAHGDCVLFSAAIPGQGGEFHVNEQPLEYWRGKFEARGFSCFDPLRPLISVNEKVEPWYRYNTLLYVRGDAAESLPQTILQSRLHSDNPIRNLSPLSWRTRNAVLRSMPQPALDVLVKLKHSWTRRQNSKKRA